MALKLETLLRNNDGESALLLGTSVEHGVEILKSGRLRPYSIPIFEWEENGEVPVQKNPEVIDAKGITLVSYDVHSEALRSAKWHALTHYFKSTGANVSNPYHFNEGGEINDVSDSPDGFQGSEPFFWLTLGMTMEAIRQKKKWDRKTVEEFVNHGLLRKGMVLGFSAEFYNLHKDKIGENQGIAGWELKTPSKGLPIMKHVTYIGLPQVAEREYFRLKMGIL